jgi:phosphomethylpyrimidine synthase
MKITKDVRKFAAEQQLPEYEALQKGLAEKSAQFVEKGRGGLREGVTMSE